MLPDPTNARTYSARRGLTLVEVTITIGVVAVAMVSLLGLLSLSLTSQAEAKHETQAVLIAGGIFAELRQGASTTHGIPIRVAASGNVATDFIYPTLTMIGSAAEFQIIYSEDGRPLSATSAFSSAKETADNEDARQRAAPMTYLVRIRIAREAHNDFLSAGSSPRAPSIHHTEISVEYPAAAPEATRKKITFSSALSLPDAT